MDFSLHYADIPSPTGRYIVRDDGIYLSGTNIPVVTRQYMGGSFKGWYYDESGVVVHEAGYSLITLVPGGRVLFTSPTLFSNCACLRSEISLQPISTAVLFVPHL